MSYAKLPSGVTGAVSNASTMSVGTDSAFDTDIITNSLSRWKWNTSGDLTQDATNGRHLIMTKASTAIATAINVAVGAAGTVIGDATQLAAVTHMITVCGVGAGVKLWDCPTGSTLLVYVNPACANAPKIYPPSGVIAINGHGGGASITAPSTSCLLRFHRYDSLNFYCMHNAITYP